MAEQTVSVRLRAVTSGFQSAMQSAAGSMGTVHRNADRLTSVGMGLTKTVTPAILGLGAAATKVGMDFEQGMSGVEAVTGATEQAMADMSDQAKELGRTTQFSATEAAGALEFLGMAGFDADEAMEALPDTLSLAAAGGLELAESADLASNVLQQFALDVEETGRVADVLAQTATNSNTSVSQLGQAMQMAGPVANAAGLEIEETAAAIGAMGNAGIQASQAGTSLRGAMTRLLNASGPAAEVIAELGINAEMADGSIRPLPEIIDQLAASGATAGQMMEIFGQRAGPAMAALVEQGGDALRDLTGTIDDSAGAAERMADVRMDNLAGDLKELKSAAEGAGIALFEAGIGDHLRSITQAASGALQSFAGLSEGAQQTVVVLGGLAAATGPAITGVGMIAAQAPKIAANFRAGLTAMRGFATFLMGPWGIAIAGATLGLTHFLREQRRVREMTEELRVELEGLAPTVGELSDEFLLSKLRQRDVLEAFADTGLTLDDLREAMSGSTEAQERLNDATHLGDDILGQVANKVPVVRNHQHDLRRTLDDLTESSRDYNDQLETENRLLGYLPSATEQAERGLMGMRGTTSVAADAMEDAAEATGELGGAAEDAAEDVDELTEALDTLAGSQLNAAEAHRAWLDGLEDLKETIEENGDTLADHTDAGRRNQEQFERNIEDAFAYGQAMIDNGESVEDATDRVLVMIQQLMNQAEEFGLTRRRAEEYIAQLGLTPEEVRTEIALISDQAMLDIADFRNNLGALPSSVDIPIRVTRPGESVAGIHRSFSGINADQLRDHGGNLITSATPSALAGLAANERARILTVGEEVLAADDPRNIRNAVAAQPRQPGTAPQSGPTYQFYTEPSDEGLHQVRKHEDRRMVREMAYG